MPRATPGIWGTPDALYYILDGPWAGVVAAAWERGFKSDLISFVFYQLHSVQCCTTIGWAAESNNNKGSRPGRQIYPLLNE